MSGVEATIGFGASVLAIAGAGISVATTLIRFSVSYSTSAKKIEELYSRISLMATILTTIGKTVENHKDFFKEDNFKELFGKVINWCEKDFGIVAEALRKAKGEVENSKSDGKRGLAEKEKGKGKFEDSRSKLESKVVERMTPWNKLVCGPWAARRK